MAGLLMLMAACDDDETPPAPVDPASAPRASIDRFSDAAGTLFRRSETPTLPEANAPIDFDQTPFITQGLGPSGQPVRYYNFDVMSDAPAPIFVLVREGESQPVAGQLNIVDVVPGQTGYNDFWQVVQVTVPSNYVANTITSLAEMVSAGYETETTNMIVNCPIVPEGSVADEGDGAAGLTQGWYRGQLVFYFNFGEEPLVAASGRVPTSPIFVTFNINPDESGGGPASGFRVQGSSTQTHNVVATLPGQQGYSPLWIVMPYDNADFDAVRDLPTAQEADGFGAADLVNCPVVFVGQTPADPASSPTASIDRFADGAAMLFRRSANPSLPAANAAIDMDQAPFITHGLGPAGERIRYYNFDVQPSEPAPIFVLFHEGTGDAVAGQLNIVDAIPGQGDYNDLWRLVRVLVPDDYIANTVTSLEQIMQAGFAMETTDIVVNCPIVPEGSTATLGGGADGLTRGWYRNQVVYYFNFDEASLMSADDGSLPTSPIYVTFTINPDMPEGGPASGFRTETGTEQTHNVVATLPGDADYSPLWAVLPYDNAAFDMVMDLSSAQNAPSFGLAALVNCPIVFVQQVTQTPARIVSDAGT